MNSYEIDKALKALIHLVNSAENLVDEAMLCLDKLEKGEAGCGDIGHRMVVNARMIRKTINYIHAIRKRGKEPGKIRFIKLS